MEIRRSFVFKWYALALWLLIATFTEISAVGDNWGVTKFDVKRVTYNWHIENYSKNGKEYGEVIKSDIFTGNDSTPYQWQLQWYPKGHTPASRAYASLYLDLVSKQPVWAEVEFAIIYRTGAPVVVKKFQKRYPGENWGFPLYIGQGWLQGGWAYWYVPEDVLTISVDITFNAGMMRASKQCRKINTEKCTSLPFTNDFMADLELVVEGKRVRVHKAVMSAHSAYIKDKLSLYPTAVAIQLPKGVELDVFKQALAFIYSGKTSADEEMLKKLLALSEKLGMDKLKLYCEQALCNAMTSKSAKEIFELAKKNNAKNLQREAKSYLIAVNDGIAKD